MPWLSGGRSGRPPDSVPSAPLGAQSDPFRQTPSPPSRRGEPAAAAGRHRRPVLAGALALVLLGFAALLAAPQTAHAQVPTVNGIGNGAEKAATDTTLTPAWSFTLRDSANNDVTELTEGGDAATATVSITNNVRFSTDQTVQLK